MTADAEIEKICAVRNWFLAHDAYHKATETYNARVGFLRAQEALGNCGMFNANGEYALMNMTQKAALRADETLYQALRSKADQPHDGSINADRLVTDTMDQ